MNNHLRTYLLLAALTALFMGVGYLIAGPSGMAVALLFAVATNLFSYWNADKIVLRLYGAEPVDETAASPLIRNYVADVHAMADQAGLPRPRVYLIDQAQPNAFATGRDPRNAAVAATVGLLQMLDRREIRGVMAHELAHVKNRDTLTMTITATIAGAISALVNFAFFFGGDRERPNIVAVLALSVLAPMAAMLVQMAISRGREYAADHGGAEISGDPEALASALQKIEAYARGGLVNEAAERNPATSHLFIINPLSGQGADNLFSTHPATGNRVAALMELAQERPHPSPQVRRTASSGGGTAVPVTRDPGPWG